MDPCWTNDPSKKAENEADISAFNMARYRRYLQKLYIPLIKDAIAHGLYVIVRPPGVCPQDISVGDKYNRYLKAIWKAFAADEYIQQNSGIISIELANEPVRVHMGDGSNSDKALHDYFQPVVNEIRAQGFKGIIWVPGTTWQQNYRDYVKHPIVDSQNNLGYAVHCYPGWYRSGSGNNDNTNKEIFYNAFLDAVPVAKTNPIIVTEIDWSPYKPGSGHKDEQGNWVESNYGTWGTATTSGFGEGWKYIHDKLGNISMTLQGSGLYFDIDTYLKNKVVEPAFKGVDEACGEACFKWYKEWYLKQNTTGIKQLETQADVVSTLYYNIEGKEVEKPTAGVYIIKQLLSNGKIRSRKVFLK